MFSQAVKHEIIDILGIKWHLEENSVYVEAVMFTGECNNMDFLLILVFMS